VLADKRIQDVEATTGQRDMLERIETALRAKPDARAAAAPAKSPRET
jgi:hypothetical protein